LRHTVRDRVFFKDYSAFYPNVLKTNSFRRENEVHFGIDILSQRLSRAKYRLKEATTLQRCPNCWKEGYCIKSGLNRNGTQRYRCQHCKRYFTHKIEEKRHAHEHGREVIIRAVRLYLEGRSLRAIARQLGVHHQTVGRWVASSSRVQRLRNIAIELYLEEESVHFACLCLSEEVSYRTVCMWIRDVLSQTLKERALSLRLKKTPLYKIKTAIGVNDVRTVRKWIRQAKAETIDAL